MRNEAKHDTPFTRTRHRTNPSITFENFVIGSSNEIAHSSAVRVVELPISQSGPLFIYGGVGLGKSHLLNAVGNRLMEINSQANVCYIHATNFISETVRALESKNLGEMRQYFQSLDLLLIDDIQYLADKPNTQHELIATLNYLVESDKLVVMTSNASSKRLSGFDPQILSRFSGVLSVAVTKPKLNTRRDILLSKAELSGIDIRKDVASYMAMRVTSSVRDLEGAINRIDAYARFHSRAITIDLAKEALLI
ncbi:MAG: ATP-binding protein [Gammaproteobacteria bacterium]|nr:ATP-binding protein [Gammaproteobacteria bacterium]